MSFYRFRYLCETSLRSEKGPAFEHDGQRIVFCFPRKGSEEGAARATLEVEAANWREADVTAQSFLQPVLDALAFATSSPLIVRELILDRFVFQWLTFEGLAGSRQIPTTCPRCGTEIAHCEKALSHEGSDRQRAYQLWSRVEPDTSIQEFTRQVWGRARNSVFHGSKYPGPELLTRLNALFPKLRRASEAELSRRYGLPDEVRPIRVLGWRSHRFNMFGWQTANAQDRFAGDFPWDSVTKEFSNWKDGEIRIADTSSWPFKVLDFAKESANW